MSMIANQIRNIVLSGSLKDLQGDERRKELDQSLAESTIGYSSGFRQPLQSVAQPHFSVKI